MTWMCDICGYIYDGEDFLKEPEDYVCPLCDHGKQYFHERDMEAEIGRAANQIISANK